MLMLFAVAEHGHLSVMAANRSVLNIGILQIHNICEFFGF